MSARSRPSTVCCGYMETQGRGEGIRRDSVPDPPNAWSTSVRFRRCGGSLSRLSTQRPRRSDAARQREPQHKIDVVCQTSSEGESQSSGAAECAVKDAKGVVASLRHAAATPWCGDYRQASFAAMVTRSQRGADRLTNQRRMGRPRKKPLPPSGECILCLLEGAGAQWREARHFHRSGVSENPELFSEICGTLRFP